MVGHRKIGIALLISTVSSLANAAPVLNNDTASVPEGGSVTVDVLSNDVATNGAIVPATVDVFQPDPARYLPENGYLSIDGQGRITYYHYGGPTVSDEVYYIVADSNGVYGEPASIAITIGDGQSNAVPVANGDSRSLSRGASVQIAVLDNDSDSDGTLLASTLTLVRTPVNGTATVGANGVITYAHDGSQSSSDSFEYTVEDNLGAISNRAIVSLSIESDQPNNAPLARNDSSTVQRGAETAIQVLANDADSDGSLVASTVQINDDPDHGTLLISGNGTITYRHDGNASTSDSFSYTVRDNDGATSNAAQVAITIQQTTADSVVLVDDTALVTAAGGSVTVNVLANDQPAVGTMTPATVDIFQPEPGTYFPEHGYLSIDAAGRISYVHYGGPTTSDIFYYVAADDSSELGEPAAVRITIGAVSSNNAPLARNDTATLATGASVTIDVLGNDSDSDGVLVPGSVTASEPGNGQVSVANNGQVTYTHNGNASAADSFTYTVADDDGAISNTASVSLTIVSDAEEIAPVANADSVTLISGGELSFSLIENDTDADGSIDPASIVIVSQPQSASAFSVEENGSVFYRHNGGSDTDSFRYTVQDSDGNRSNAATVSITLTPVVEAGTVSAFHRSGQTFLTWEETGPNDGYHVYRHSQPITAQNLNVAEKLTRKWGALGSDTSINQYGGPSVPQNYVISDLGTPLSNSTGLFVYTKQPGDSSTAYYAVTPVRDGNEMTGTVLSSRSAVNESVGTPRDVLTVSVNQGKGRIYTQYMDYANWNPTFNGYAYNYTVALPSSYNSSQSYPLMVELHAYYEVYKSIPQSEYDWQVITLLPHDPGPALGALHSWWYGYARDHNYAAQGSTPTSGAIENFTEQRVMRAVAALIDDTAFNVDTNKIHAYGNSMGASGVLALGMRYGNVFSGVYANQPMTDYQSNPLFQGELVQTWGSKSSNLPVVNDGPFSEGIQLYGLNGVSPVGVWDWMDHHQQLVERRGDTFAYLMTFHGKQDTIIDWATQGRPTVRALTEATAGFAAVHGGTAGHTWVGFSSVNVSLFGFGYGDDFGWKYPLNLSFPSITNASGSGPIDPANSGDDRYNMDIEWATPHTAFSQTIVDLIQRYEITLKSTSANQTADITPRRTQQFDPNPGQVCNWTATDNNNGQQIASRSATTDIDSLLTATAVPIRTGAGTRLSINCSQAELDEAPLLADPAQ